MINIGFGVNLILGFLLVIGVLILYFVRIIRPELSRDEDIFFTTLGLVYSCILIIHGWRLDPILLFSQVLIISLSLAAGWENIRLRGLLAKKLKRQLKSLDEDE
jgi:Sec-independent protein secretion pathway component TatC